MNSGPSGEKSYYLESGEPQFGDLELPHREPATQERFMDAWTALNRTDGRSAEVAELAHDANFKQLQEGDDRPDVQ